MGRSDHFNEGAGDRPVWIQTRRNNNARIGNVTTTHIIHTEKHKGVGKWAVPYSSRAHFEKAHPNAKSALECDKCRGA